MPPPKQKRRETAAERRAVAPDADDLKDMLPKSTERHNRFRFRNLRERAVGAKERLSRAGLSKSDTFDGLRGRLGDSIWHWQDELRLRHQDIDHSPLFRSFYAKVGPISATLPLLLHHLPEVVKHLVAFLDDDNLPDGPLRSFLNLIGVLAKDLQSHLLPHVQALMGGLLHRVDPKSPEKTADVFKTLAIVLIQVSKPMAQRLSILRPFYPLVLGHRTRFVREYAAKCFSSLLRRTDTFLVTKHICGVLLDVSSSEGRKNPDLREGIAMLTFETIKNVGKRFHSKHIEMLPSVLRVTSAAQSRIHKNVVVTQSSEEALIRSDNDESWIGEFSDVAFDIVRRVLTSMRRYTDMDSCAKVWESIHDNLDKSLKAMRKVNSRTCDSANDAMKQSCRMLALLSEWVSHRKGELVTTIERRRLEETLKMLYESNDCEEEGDEHFWKMMKIDASDKTVSFAMSRLHLLAMSWIALRNNDNIDNPHPLLPSLKRAISISITRGATYARRALKSLRLPAWAPEISKSSLRRAVTSLIGSIVSDQMISCYSSKEKMSAMLSLLLRVGTFNAEDDERSDYEPVCNIVFVPTTTGNIVNALVGFLRYLRKTQTWSSRGSEMWAALRYLNAQCRDADGMDKQTVEDASELSAFFFKSCVGAIISYHDDASNAETGEIVDVQKVTAVECSTLMSLRTFEELTLTLTMKWFRSHVTCPYALRVVYNMSRALTQSPTHRRVVDEIVSVIGKNLSATSQLVRLLSLRILCSLVSDESILHDLLYVERHGRVPSEERNVRARLENIGAALRSNVVQSKTVVRFIVDHSIGLTCVRYSRLWPVLQKVLRNVAVLHFEDLWLAVHDEMRDLIWSDQSNNHSRKDVTIHQDDNRELSGDCYLLHLCHSTMVCMKSVNADDYGKSIKHGEGYAVVDSHVTAPSKRLQILLGSLALTPVLSETKNKQLISRFFECVQNEYSRPVFISQDPDAWELVAIVRAKVQSRDRLVCGSSHGSIQDGTVRIVAFLDLFEKFSNLKSCYASNDLRRVLLVLLSKSGTSEAALRCLFSFRDRSIWPYKRLLQDLLDHTKRRERMATFSLSAIGSEDNDMRTIEGDDGNTNGKILREHRDNFVDVLIRIVVGLLSYRKKKGKGARGDRFSMQRNALIVFLSQLEVNEIAIFIRSLSRAFYVDPLRRGPECVLGFYLPDKEQLSAFRLSLEKSRAHIDLSCCHLSMIQRRITDLTGRISRGVTMSRQIAFASTAQALIKHLGRKVLPCLCLIIEPCLAMLKLSCDSIKDQKGRRDASRLRPYCMKILGSLWQRFPDFQWTQWSLFYLPILRPLVESLPDVVSNASDNKSAPSILSSLYELSVDSRLWVQFEQGNFIEALLRCLSVGFDDEKQQRPAGDVVVNVVFDILENLSSNTDAFVADSNDELVARSPLTSCLPQVLDHLYLRFSKTRNRGVAISRMIKGVFAPRALRLLSTLGQPLIEMLQEDERFLGTAEKLITLLLPFLDPKAECADSIRLNILRIVSSILPRLDVADRDRHLLTLARLLSPFKSFDSRDLRLALVDVFVKTSENTKWLRKPSLLLRELNAYDTTSVSSYDFDRRGAAFTEIDNGASLLESSRTSLEIILRQFVWSLNDDEMLIRRYAGTGVSKIVQNIAEVATDKSGTSRDELVSIVKAAVFPGIRDWLQNRSTPETSRREIFVLLTESISLFSKLSNHPSLHGDLAPLCRPKDAEADIWRNLLHAQSHRRVRAIQRMIKAIGSYNISFLAPFSHCARTRSTGNAIPSSMSRSLLLNERNIDNLISALCFRVLSVTTQRT